MKYSSDSAIRSSSLATWEQRVVGIADGGQHLVGALLHHLGARVVVFVHAVAEAHQLVFLGLHALDELRDLVRGADLLEHVERLFIGTAVRRAPQAGDAGGDTGERVGTRRAGEADGRGRGVLLVVGVQDEDAVHGTGQYRIDDIVLGRDGEAHAQEILGVAQVVARRNEGLAHVIFEGARRDRRHLGDQPDGRNVALDRIMDVQAVVIEGRQGPDRADHDGHRVGVAAEALEEAVELGVQHGVGGDAAFEGLVFRGRGQLAVQEQVADLDEVGLRGQLVDRIAAVQQGADVAVDEGQPALAGRRRGEAGIVGEGVGRAVQLADVDDIGASRARKHGQVYGLVAVGQRRRPGGFGLFGHISPLLQSAA